MSVVDVHELRVGDHVRMAVDGPLDQCAPVFHRGQYLGHALAADGAYFRTDICKTLRLEVVDVDPSAADRIAAALAIHAPRCKRCMYPINECDGHAEWRDEWSKHDPTPECTVCVASWSDEGTEPWPCPTARALGVGDQSPGVPR